MHSQWHRKMFSSRGGGGGAVTKSACKAREKFCLPRPLSPWSATSPHHVARKRWLHPAFSRACYGAQASAEASWATSFRASDYQKRKCLLLLENEGFYETPLDPASGIATGPGSRRALPPLLFWAGGLEPPLPPGSYAPDSGHGYLIVATASDQANTVITNSLATPRAV